MKNRNWLWLRGLSFILLFTACSKPKEEKENRAPGTFAVSVTNVTFNSATLTWTAAVDPENEAVTYSVELAGQTITSSLSATTQNLTALQKNKSYTGTVTAKDPSGHSTAITFSFNTGDSPPPSDFTLTLNNSTNSSLAVSWTASTLPNNDPVQYDVYVGATLKATNITQTAYTAAGLTPKTAYQIKVVAKSAEGKSTEKILAAQTADNVAPVTFTAQEVDHGFSNVRLKWNAAVDANNDSLSYFLSRNGILTPLTEVPVSGIYTYVVKNLSASTAYSVSIVAKDPYGGEAVSNTVQGTTNAGPANDFLFTAKNSGSNVELEWIQSYPGQFDPATSSYIINGVEKSLSTVQVSFLNTGSGLYVKIILPAADFPDNTQRPIKLKLGWGANENTTQSRTVNHTRYFLSATTALVSSAVLKTYSNGDKGYVLTFANDKISDFSTWNVVEVKFENCIQPGTVSLQFPTGQTVQSVFGGLPQNDYDYLKTRSEGYLVVQDAGGYHRLNFSYTVL